MLTVARANLNEQQTSHYLSTADLLIIDSVIKGILYHWIIFARMNSVEMTCSSMQIMTQVM